jgi:hypothetical protein
MRPKELASWRPTESDHASARFAPATPTGTRRAYLSRHLLIALADKLWKGKREEDLEMLVIERLADSIGGEVAAVFAEADAIFEAVSSRGDDRLARSSIS